MKGFGLRVVIGGGGMVGLFGFWWEFEFSWLRLTGELRLVGWVLICGCVYLVVFGSAECLVFAVSVLRLVAV